MNKLSNKLYKFIILNKHVANTKLFNYNINYVNVLLSRYIYNLNIRIILLLFIENVWIVMTMKGKYLFMNNNLNFNKI